MRAAASPSAAAGIARCQASRARATFDAHGLGAITRSRGIPIAAAMPSNVSAGAAGDCNAILLTPTGKIQACRRFGSDVDDTHGSFHHRTSAKSPYRIFRPQLNILYGGRAPSTAAGFDLGVSVAPAFACARKTEPPSCLYPLADLGG
jgi:hypothetical protein